MLLFSVSLGKLLLENIRKFYGELFHMPDYRARNGITNASVLIPQAAAMFPLEWLLQWMGEWIKGFYLLVYYKQLYMIRINSSLNTMVKTYCQ